MQGAPIHSDAYETFDHRLPLDAFQGDEQRWPLYLAAWALLAVLAAGVAAWIGRRSGTSTGSWRFSWVAFASLVTLLPSVRDGALVLAVLGLAALWVIAARVAPAPPSIARSMTSIWERVLAVPPARFALALFAGVVLLDLALGWLVFRWVPVIQDSQAQLFQARLLAEGRVVAETPPLGEFFLAENMIQRGEAWYSIYPPGHVVPLTLGVLLGVPFLVNPVLLGITTVAIYGATREGLGEETARTAGLLGAISPFLAYMGSEAMNHASCGAAFAIELFAIARLVARPGGAARGAAWGALAGLAGGWMLLTRPLTFVALNAACGLFLVARAIATRDRGLFAAIAALPLTAALAILVQLEWNRRANGDPMVFGHTLLFPTMRWGFGPSPWGVHTPFRALEFTIRNGDAVNLYLLGGPLPGLVLAILGFARSRARPFAWLALGAFLAALATYAGFCFQDLTFGPRYVYEGSLALVPLAAAGLPVAVRIVSGAHGDDPEARRRRAITTAIAIAIALVSILPGLGVYYRTVYSLDRDVVARARAELPPDALVFVGGKYQRAFWAVDAELASPMLFARDLGEHDAALACSMPERPAFVEQDDGTFEPYRPDCER